MESIIVHVNDDDYCDDGTPHLRSTTSKALSSSSSSSLSSTLLLPSSRPRSEIFKIKGRRRRSKRNNNNSSKDEIKMMTITIMKWIWRQCQWLWKIITIDCFSYSNRFNSIRHYSIQNDMNNQHYNLRSSSNNRWSYWDRWSNILLLLSIATTLLFGNCNNNNNNNNPTIIYNNRNENGKRKNGSNNTIPRILKRSTSSICNSNNHQQDANDNNKCTKEQRMTILQLPPLPIVFELVYHRTNDGEGILVPKYDDDNNNNSNNSRNKMDQHYNNNRKDNYEYYYEGISSIVGHVNQFTLSWHRQWKRFLNNERKHFLNNERKRENKKRDESMFLQTNNNINENDDSIYELDDYYIYDELDDYVIQQPHALRHYFAYDDDYKRDPNNYIYEDNNDEDSYTTITATNIMDETAEVEGKETKAERSHCHRPSWYNEVHVTCNIVHEIDIIESVSGGGNQKSNNATSGYLGSGAYRDAWLLPHQSVLKTLRSFHNIDIDIDMDQIVVCVVQQYGIFPTTNIIYIIIMIIITTSHLIHLIYIGLY